MSKHSSASYYKKNKERLQKKHVKDIKIFLKKKKKKRKYWHERYENLPKDEKQKFAHYRKKYFKKWKNVSRPAGIYLFKVNNRNTRTRCVICSKLTIKTPERRH